MSIRMRIGMKLGVGSEISTDIRTGMRLLIRNRIEIEIRIGMGMYMRIGSWIGIMDRYSRRGG